MELTAVIRTRLQLKLVAIVAAVFGIILIASTVVLMVSVNKLGRASIQRQLNEEKIIIEQRINEMGTELQQTASLVSYHPLVIESLAEDNSSLVTDYLQMAATELGHDLISVVDLSGTIISEFAGAGEITFDDDLRALLIQTAEPVTRIMVVDQSHLILAVTPVYSTSQELLGFVVAVDLIDGALLGQVNLLRDNVALAIFADDPRAVGVVANETDGQPHLTPAEVEALRIDDAILAQIHDGETIDLFDVMVRGTLHAVTYRPLKMNGEFAGYYVIAIDENGPRAVQKNVFLISLVTVFVVLFIMGLLIAWGLRQFVTGPLKVLSQAAYQLGIGQSDVRIKPSSRDEIGQLYETFNNMAEQVELRTEELNSLNQVLETRVIERTNQIKQQNVWLEAIVCEAQEAIIVTDETGNVRLINDAALKILGIQESLALGIPLPKLMEEAIDSAFDRPSLSDKSRGEVEINGRFYLYSTTGIRPDDADINGYVCILSDVTPLHKLNTLKSQVIRIASHDLRSPLTALRMHHYLLKKQYSAPNNAQLDIMQRMENSIFDMQQLIDDLLNLDYIEHQAQGERDITSVDKLLASGISLLTSQIQIKNQRVEMEIIGNIPPVCGDPVRLLEAIRNYLTNAIKYTPEGGTINAYVYADELHVHVKIKDNGIGIDAADLNQVFDSRFRAQTALTAHQEGSGIGLSLVKAIIEEHGGKVWAESQPGLGSIFGFSLPIDQSCLLESIE